MDSEVEVDSRTHNPTAGAKKKRSTRDGNHRLQQEDNNQTDDWNPSQMTSCNCGSTGHYRNGVAFGGHRHAQTSEGLAEGIPISLQIF